MCIKKFDIVEISLRSSILQQFQFNNSLLQLLQEKEKTSNSMYCILFIFMFHSSALSKWTPLEH